MRFISIVTAALLAIGAAQAASNNLPNGKPFKILSTQIEQVQTQVDQLRDDYNALRSDLTLLINRVDTIEQKQERIIQAIQTLQAKDADLQAQIDTINTDMATMQEQISANSDAIAQLRTQVAALELLRADIIALQAEDAILHTLISTNTGNIEHLNNQLQSNLLRIEALELEVAKIPDLETEIFSLENDIATLEDRVNMIPELERLMIENRDAISDLEVRLSHLEDLVAFKQNVVNGSCPAGQAMAAVNPDGSVVCTPVNGGAGSLDILITYNYAETNDRTTATLTAAATCPADYLAVGGSYLNDSEQNSGPWKYFTSKISETKIVGNAWHVTASRTNTGENVHLFVGAAATCLKLSE